MARGVAFQLVEALGVLERQKVAEEVKGLDQASRATLRKYGVRFGAYHIYLPLLLKPAPRALATQLWALKHESPDAKGVPELLHLAASRTHVDPARQGDAEGALPHRRLSRRRRARGAGRHPGAARRPHSPGAVLARRLEPVPKPAGAFDGRGFTVTGAMTSLTGASGEDFASILRSLGYRMDRRPKPPEVPAAETPVASGDAPATESRGGNRRSCGWRSCGADRASNRCRGRAANRPKLLRQRPHLQPQHLKSSQRHRPLPNRMLHRSPTPS